MNNQQGFDKVAVRGRTVPQTRVVERIDLKALILQIIQDLLQNSTLTYNGETQTVQYGYNGHGRSYTLSSSPIYPQLEYEDDPEI